MDLPFRVVIIDMNDLFGLWPHQVKLNNEIELSLNQGIKSICIQSATGSGKSRIIRTITESHSRSKKIIYILVHRKKLVSQLSNELFAIDLKHGILQAGFPYIRYRIQVASLQTIVRRNVPKPDMIIIDECHHVNSNSYLKLLQKWPNAKILGFTATPQRTDGKPLGDIFQKLILGEPVKKLIDNGYLIPYQYLAPDNISMQGVHKRMGEYVQSEVLIRVDKRIITGSAIDHYQKYANHMPAIVSCVNIIHSEHVAQDFKHHGYRAIAVHSKMNDIDINNAINGLKNGTVEILCQCDLLGEGVDIKGATALIGLRPTNSLMVFLQHIGRVLRICEGKKEAIILDHVGNYERFGMPDDEIEWSLDGKKKKNSEKPKYKRCPMCIRPVPISARKCIFCGHLWTETEEQALGRIPEQVEGELINVKDMKQKQHLYLIIAREANTLKEAMAIGKKHGVSHRYIYYTWTHVLKRKRT